MKIGTSRFFRPAFRCEAIVLLALLIILFPAVRSSGQEAAVDASTVVEALVANLNLSLQRDGFVPGNVEGSASVSMSGSAQYNVPLVAAPGTGGMSPRLFLTYDSGALGQTLGLGWSLAGLSSINPVNKTFAIDGLVEGIDFDANDGLALDGARLVPAPEAGSNLLSKLSDDQTRVARVDGGFRAQTKSGLTMVYGIRSDARVTTADGKILAWLCESVTDTFGNSMEFFYRQNGRGDWGLDRVEYTSNANTVPPLEPYAVFTVLYAEQGSPHYLPPGQARVSYIAGQRVEQDLVVLGFESRVDGLLHRKYELDYERTDRLGIRRLTSISEVGAYGERKPPTVFEYSSPVASWESKPSYALPQDFAFSQSVEPSYRLVDIQGDRTPELVFASLIDGRLVSRTYALSGGTWNAVPGLGLKTHISSSEGGGGVAFFDVDRNGWRDLVVSRKGNGTESTVFLNDGSAWTERPSLAPPFVLSEQGRASTVVAEHSIDGRAVLVAIGQSSEIRAVWHDGTSWQELALGTVGRGLPVAVHSGDFHPDAGDELLVILDDAGTMQAVMGRIDTSGSTPQWVELGLETLAGDFRRALVLDGTSQQSVAIWIGSSSGDAVAEVAFGMGPTGDVELRQIPVPLPQHNGLRVLGIAAAEFEAGGGSELALQVSAGPAIQVMKRNATNGEWIGSGTLSFGGSAEEAAMARSAYILPFDIEANGLTDLLLLPTTNVVPTAALVNEGQSWRFDKQLVPNIAFSIAEKVGAGPQFVDLNGDGLTDFLGNHVDADGASVRAVGINTGQGWLTNAEYDAKFLDPIKDLPLSRSKSGATGVFIDFTSDGVADYLYGYGSELRAFRSAFSDQDEPLGWVEVPAYAPPEAFVEDNFGDRGVRFIDLNADARVDMVISRRDGAGRIFSAAYLNTGSGWVAADAKYRLPVPLVSSYYLDSSYGAPGASYYRDLRVEFIDLNGDGLLDVLYWYRFVQDDNNALARGCLNIPVQNPDSTEEQPLPDIEPVIPVAGNCAGAYLNTGSGWQALSDKFFPTAPLDLDATNRAAQIDFVDVNGDGLVDFVPAYLVGGHAQYDTHLNTGAGWVTSRGNTLPAAALTENEKQVSHRLIDLNADGLLDLAFARPQDKGAYLNTGISWVRDDRFAPTEAFLDDAGTDLGVRFVDVDGNGLPDLLKSFRATDGTVSRVVALNGAARADTLIAATNGMGLRTEFDYRSMLTVRLGEVGGAFYEASPVSEYPIISMVPPIYAVERMRVVEDGLRSTEISYRYKGFRFDAAAGMPLGVQARWATGEVKELVGGPGTWAYQPVALVEYIEAYQDYYRNGRTKLERTSVGASVVAETTYVHEVIPRAGSGPARVVLTGSTTAKLGLDGVLQSGTTETFRYDPWSNLIESCVLFGDGSWTLVENSYRDDLGAKWFLGRLVHAVSTTSLPTDRNECTASAADDAGAVRRTVADFEYDPITGVLVEEVANAETEFAVTTFRQYDVFGNIVSQVTEAPSLAPRVAETTFDARGRFAIGQQNALGHRSTLSFDEQLALVVETKDPNGVTTSSQYDGFGRLTEMVSPTGVVATEASYFADVPPISDHAVALVQTKVVGDMPPQISFLDVQGRVLRTQVEGFDGRPVFSDAQYDAYGRTSAASLPYYEGDTIYWGTVWYDALNRPVVNVRPDGAETITRYLALTTTVTDPLGGETETERDLKGNTIRTVDQKGDVVEFEYGAGELLLSVSTIADGVTLVTEHAYDAAGNRVSTTDPDLGTWSYQYNAFGQLVWQRDAKGQDSTVSYDAIGRVSSFVRPDSVVKYSYDSKPFGIGQVSVMTSNRQIAMAAIGTLGGQTYSEEFEYDGYSRPFRKVTTVNGEVFAATLRYDEHNRPIEAAYPGGFVVRNSYDEQGLLSQVRVKEPNQPIGEMGAIRWEALERDQQGRILKERFGNDVETSHAFDPQRGFESSISAQNASGTTVLDLALSYDAAGNLVEKQEAALGQTERFEYDSAYRLVEWELNGESEGRYEYDGRGRLLYKSGVGRYDYEGPGPAQGVKEIVAPDGSVQSYEYDPNGNLIIGPKGHFNFFSDNLVQHIYASPDYWSSFQYAPDGSRYLHSAHDGNRLTETLTIGPYEQIREHYGPESTGTADLVRRRLYVMGDTGIIAVVEDTVQFDPFGGDSPSFANGSNELIAKLAVTTHYLQKDQLGSVVAITNGEGAVTDRFSYDPWGAKDWQANKRPGAAGEIISGTFHRGFTGHEHLDHLALIHMNGRVYDPTTAQFVSADPQVQVPFALDTYNRYSYASNNPLRYFDPSGYGLFDSIGDFFGGVWDAITSPYRAAWSWLKENWRTVVVITVAVALSTVTGGIGGAILIGAVSGGLNAALYGGSFSDIMRGGVIGAFTGAATFGAGSLGASVGGNWGTVTGVAGHGVVGGAGAEMNGGNFWSGFAAGATAKAFAGPVSSIENAALETVAASAVGGTVSVVGGGKFADGAITGAYSHLLNDVMNRPVSASTRPARLGKLPRAYVGGAADKLIHGEVLRAYETYGTVSDKYFTWDQSDELAAWIQKHGGEVEVYAHSWGADTAAEVVAAGNRVELLVTADPVGYTRPDFQAVNDNSTSWVNKNAQGPASFPNFIAGIGRAWNEAPASYAKHELMKNADHADYCDMAKGACR